jgi:hypothetical protein
MWCYSALYSLENFIRKFFEAPPQNTPPTPKKENIFNESNHGMYCKSTENRWKHILRDHSLHFGKVYLLVIKFSTEPQIPYFEVKS